MPMFTSGRLINVGELEAVDQLSSSRVPVQQRIGSCRTHEETIVFVETQSQQRIIELEFPCQSYCCTIP